jgi:hypothetical protein
LSVAVLIVNFRGYDDLARCLGSLRPQLRAGDEVVVVDHESDEHRLGTALAHHSSILPVPRVDNPGFAAGVNTAARHTRASLLWLLNPDAIIEGPVLSVLENWLLTHNETWVVGPRVLNVDGSTQPSARGFPGPSTLLGGRSTWLTRKRPNNWWSRRNLLGLDTAQALDVDWISGACLMTRRDVFERLGGLDESFFLYWEDADYCRRVARAGGRCTYLPWVTVRHRAGRSAQYDLPRAIRAFHESAFRLYWKHSSPAARLLSPLVRAGLHMRCAIRLRTEGRDDTPSIGGSALGHGPEPTPSAGDGSAPEI